jgi:hypothetical protein
MLFVDGGTDKVGIGTSAFVDTSKVQIEGAKALTSGILQGQLNISDSTAVATGAGGGISFSGNYNGTSKTTFGSIEGSKDNGTSGHYGASLVFKTRSNGGANAENMRIDSSGNVTMPAQPAFSVHKNGTDQNDIGTGDVTVTWSSERFDVGSNFGAAGFTAPVTGKYQLQASIRFDNLDASHTYIMVVIKTSNENYRFIIDPDFGQDAAYFTISGSILADMDASDTAIIFVTRYGGESISDIDGDAEYTHFSGYLAC